MTATENTTTEPKAAEKTCEEALDRRIDRLYKAHDSVKNYTLSAMTVGFVPIPVVDMLALSVIQLKMLHGLANRYEVPFSDNLAKSMLSSLLGGSLAVSIAMPVASLIKSVPFIGQASGMMTTSVIGAASTYAVGKIFVGHFESGGTFLDFDVEKAKAHFKELYEEGKSFVSAQKTT